MPQQAYLASLHSPPSKSSKSHHTSSHVIFHTYSQLHYTPTLQLHLLLHIRLQPLLQLLHTHLLSPPIHLLPTRRILRWHKHIAHHLNDAIARHAIMHRHARKPIDPDGDERAIPRYVDGEIFAGQDGGEVVVVVWGAGVNLFFVVVDFVVTVVLVLFGAVIERIRIKRLINNHMILQQRLQILLPIPTKQERINPRAQLLKREIARRKQRPALVFVLGAVQLVENPGFREGELERAEFAGEERDDGCDGRRGDEDGVDPVDHAVGAEDVDGDELGVEV